VLGIWDAHCAMVGLLRLYNNPRTGLLCEPLVVLKGGKCLTYSEGDQRDTHKNKKKLK